MTTISKSSRWQNLRLSRRRWSLNAVRARERNRLNQAEPVYDVPTANVFKPKSPRFDLKVFLERRDGMRLQFTLHHFQGRLIGQTVQMTPKQFGRKLGEIFSLWMKP